MIEKNLPIVLGVVTVTLMVFSLPLLFSVSSEITSQTQRISSMESDFALTAELASVAGNANDFLANLIPQGIPPIYGAELGVSFDKPVEGLAVLKDLDPGYGSKKIALEGDLLQRYINIGTQISCEYCCSAKSMVFADGRPACGCKHSWGMRGLAAYLLQNHGEEYTDDGILEELTKWKTLFFPKQTIAKAIKLAEESGSSTIDPKLLNEIPDMIGGC